MEINTLSYADFCKMFSKKLSVAILDKQCFGILSIFLVVLIVTDK